MKALTRPVLTSADTACRKAIISQLAHSWNYVFWSHIIGDQYYSLKVIFIILYITLGHINNEMDSRPICAQHIQPSGQNL